MVNYFSSASFDFPIIRFWKTKISRWKSFHMLILQFICLRIWHLSTAADQPKLYKIDERGDDYTSITIRRQDTQAISFGSYFLTMVTSVLESKEHTKNIWGSIKSWCLSKLSFDVVWSRQSSCAQLSQAYRKGEFRRFLHQSCSKLTGWRLQKQQSYLPC